MPGQNRLSVVTASLLDTRTHAIETPRMYLWTRRAHKERLTFTKGAKPKQFRLRTYVRMRVITHNLLQMLFPPLTTPTRKHMCYREPVLHCAGALRELNDLDSIVATLARSPVDHPI